jgi:small subunit ribosomal protein S17
MAEKTTTKKPAAKATAAKTAATKEKAAPAKTAAAKKPEREAAAPAREAAAPARAKAVAAEPRVSSAAVKAASAPRTAQGKAASAAVSARKQVTVRKRTATTVAHTSTPAGEAATGWRRFHGKTKVGVVISAKQPKTVIVTVGRMREHPLYKKVIRLRKGFAAHDEAGEVREGDLVRIQESRPYSATKRWRVVEVLSRTGEAGAAAPKVADIAGQLEASEGVSELFAKPEREEEEEEAK